MHPRDRKLQEEALLRFETNAFDFEASLSANPGKETLRELLRGRGPYGGTGLSATIAPYEFARVSVPKSVVATPYVEDLLPDGGRDLLREFESQMMHDGVERERIRLEEEVPGRHVDPPSCC